MKKMATREGLDVAKIKMVVVASKNTNFLHEGIILIEIMIESHRPTGVISLV